MFGQKKERTFEDYRAELLPGALADISRQREEEPKLLAKYEADLQSERAAYKIRFEKYGTALALFIEGQSGWEKTVTKALHTVNLIASPNTISLIEGRAPDMNGAKWCSVHTTDGKPSYTWSSRDHDHGWYNNPYGGDSFLRLDPKPRKQDGMFGGVSYSGDIRQRMDGCARAAEPDRIRFEGAGATLIVPFGMGEDIYRRILATLASTDGQQPA